MLGVQKLPRSVAAAAGPTTKVMSVIEYLQGSLGTSKVFACFPSKLLLTSRPLVPDPAPQPAPSIMNAEDGGGIDETSAVIAMLNRVAAGEFRAELGLQRKRKMFEDIAASSKRIAKGSRTLSGMIYSDIGELVALILSYKSGASVVVIDDVNIRVHQLDDDIGKRVIVFQRDADGALQAPMTLDSFAQLRSVLVDHIGARFEQLSKARIESLRTYAHFLGIGDAIVNKKKAEISEALVNLVLYKIRRSSMDLKQYF
jgi:hypothetical protein